MITYFEGTVFNTDADAIVNTVNCTGVMSAGIALEYALRYPTMYEDYKEKCQQNKINVGLVDYYHSEDKTIINFPTKWHFKYPSQLPWIENGLKNFVATYKQHGITKVAFPKLGTNNGKLPWSKVQKLMEQYLSPLPIQVYICLDTKPEAEGLEKTLLDVFNNTDINEIKKYVKLTSKQIDILNKAKPVNRFWKIKELDGISSGTYGKLFDYCKNKSTGNLEEQLSLF